MEYSFAGSSPSLTKLCHLPMRHEDGEVVVDRLVELELGLARADHRAQGASLEAKELIVVVVDLSADLATGRNGHNGELQVLAGPEGVTEGVVVDRGLLNVYCVGLRAVISSPVRHTNLSLHTEYVYTFDDTPYSASGLASLRTFAGTPR